MRRLPMRRIVLATLLAFGLLWPTSIAQPRVASADFLEVFGAICDFFGGCEPFSVTDTPGCAITAVGASASRDSKGARVDKFDYRLASPCSDIHVVGTFNLGSSEVSERLEGNGRTIYGRWTCSTDPWIYPAGQPPNCTRIAISVTGSEKGLDF